MILIQNGRYRNIQWHDKKTYRASITVEAAFVMPIVVLTVFALLYLTFYLHDICRIQGIVDGTLHEAGLMMKHDFDSITAEIDYENIKNQGIFDLRLEESSKSEQNLQAYLGQRLESGLFLTHIEDIKAGVGRTKLTISVEANAMISLPWIKNLLGSYSHSVIEGEYPIHDPAESIRVCDVILDTAAQIKGVEELKSKLEGFYQRE